jgi:hypothetical protein
MYTYTPHSGNVPLYNKLGVSALVTDESLYFFQLTLCGVRVISEAEQIQRLKKLSDALYRVFYVKCNPNYHAWTPKRTKRRNQWQYWILAAVSRCCSWCTAWNRYGRNFSCFVARWTFVTDKHFLCPDILLPVGVLSYSVLPCQDTHC